MIETAALLKVQTGVSVGVLLVLWLLETWIPVFVDRPHRLQHAARHLVIAGINLAVMGLLFSTAAAGAAAWAERARFGLLHRLAAPLWLELPLALVLFDAWMYLWHRANHTLSFLWRFHRMHHSDPEVDVTTALRFHVGEITLSSTLRLAVIPLLGLHLWEVILYETLLLPVIAFHHSNVALPEAWDRWLRTVIVSPNMHRVHHSDWPPETDSNFSSIFSWWDRLGRSFRLRKEVRSLHYGLDQFYNQEWQSLSGLLRTPLAERDPAGPPHAARAAHAQSRRSSEKNGASGRGCG
jgi:sterol desaturase/sphingolipid hydroxylase (fatty acid hydroxylase superfamily)